MARTEHRRGTDADEPGPLSRGCGEQAMLAEVRRVLAGLAEGAGALVAISGGPDSTALAHLVAAARGDLELDLVHVRHGLREVPGELAAVRAHAAALDRPLHVEEVTVEASGRGLEAAARRARYAALGARARAVGAGAVLVGHTAEDQAETLLLRLARGTGVPGLGGMAAEAPHPGPDEELRLVRPLLRLRRDDVRAWVRERDLATVSDPMNDDPAVRRVRARREALPALERLGPDAVGALARLADLARRDARLLDEQAAAAATRLVRRVGPVVAVPSDELARLPIPLATRVVRRLVGEVRGGGHPLSAEHTTAVLGLRPGSAVDLPGARATAGGGWLALGPAGIPPPEPAVLEVPGELAWPALEVVLRARPVGGGVPGPASKAGPVPGAFPGADPTRDRVVIDPGDAGELRVRPRRPGDRVTTAAGTRKLKDVMIDAGVPRLLRELVPVVEADGRVLWVPGLAVDAEAARGAPDLDLALVGTD